jgi:hypothetical protein
MEKDQFVAVETQDWWLLQPDLEPALEDRRRALGECWNWTELRWYAERVKLEEVFQFLELNRADLLRELDEVNDDLYRRQKWVDDVIKAKKPPEPTTPESAAPAAKKAAETEPAQPSAPKKASAFGRRGTAEGAPADSSPAPAAQPAGATPGGAAAETEPRKPSPFAKKAAAASGPAAQAAAGAAESAEQIRASLAQLAADPNVPVSAEQVEELLKDPNFASNLAQAEAAIEAELAAELAAAQADV